MLILSPNILIFQKFIMPDPNLKILYTCEAVAVDNFIKTEHSQS